jgi:hypothetical protein
MLRALAILTVLTALCACSGESGTEAPYAWGIDGVSYWEGVSATELSATVDETEKALQHRNGHNQGNTGAQGSCGSLASSSVWCRLRTEDKGVWLYIQDVDAAGYISAGIFSGQNRLNHQGVDITAAPNAASADLEVEGVASLGVDWSLTCTDMKLQPISTTNGTRTIEICMHWKLDVATQRPGETDLRYTLRTYRTGIIVLGSVLGLKASSCGGAMAMSLIADSFAYPDYCSQQKSLIAEFRPWYSSGAYFYNSSAPVGL